MAGPEVPLPLAHEPLSTGPGHPLGLAQALLDLATMPQPLANPMRPAQSTVPPGPGPVAPTPGGTAPAGEPPLPPFEWSYNPDIGEGIREAEQSSGYGTKNIGDDGAIVAYGKYPLQNAALVDAGLKDDDRNWTGKWGVNTDDEFFDNKNNAQDRAFESYLDSMLDDNRIIGNLDYIGRENHRRIYDGGPLRITEAGILAASHRAGQGWVREYFRWAEANDWRTDGAPFPETAGIDCQNADKSRRACTPAEIRAKLLAVETRFRLFENIPLR